MRESLLLSAALLLIVASILLAGCTAGDYSNSPGQNTPPSGPDYGTQCNAGYVLGDDGACHPECGSGTYCTGNSRCMNGHCLGCNAGEILGDDAMCHPECGNTGKYCTGGSKCLNGRCLTCNAGYYLATDGKCYPGNGGGGGNVGGGGNNVQIDANTGCPPPGSSGLECSQWIQVGTCSIQGCTCFYSGANGDTSHAYFHIDGVGYIRCSGEGLSISCYSAAQEVASRCGATVPWYQ